MTHNRRSLTTAGQSARVRASLEICWGITCAGGISSKSSQACLSCRHGQPTRNRPKKCVVSAVLMAHREDDPEFQEYLTAFRQGLKKFGWIEDRNYRLETRWGALDDAQVRQRSAKELLAANP